MKRFRGLTVRLWENLAHKGVGMNEGTTGAMSPSRAMGLWWEALITHHEGKEAVAKLLDEEARAWAATLLQERKRASTTYTKADLAELERDVAQDGPWAKGPSVSNWSGATMGRDPKPPPAKTMKGIALRMGLVTLLQQWQEANGGQPPAGVGTYTDPQNLVALLSPQKAARDRRRVRHDQAERVAGGELARCLLDDPDLTVERVDLVERGQGSWLFDNELSPWVERDITPLVLDRLRDPVGRNIGVLVVVAGPPMAGKTRLVYEMLTRSVPQHRLWRPGAASGQLAALHAYLLKNPPPADQPRPVVLLDDLQAYQPGTDLHERILHDLVDKWRMIVVATVHPEFLTRLEHAQFEHRFDHAMGTTAGTVSAGLVHTLQTARIDVPHNFTEAELEGVDGEYVNRAANANVDTEDFKRLPELLAAVDQLRARRNAPPNPYASSLMSAMIDAWHLHPAGATLEQFATLHRIHHSIQYHHQPWREGHHDAAVDWACEPVGAAGSSHALLLRTSDTDETWRFHDRLAADVQEWSPRHLIPHVNHLDAGAIEKGAVLLLMGGEWDAGRAWLEQAAAGGDARSMDFVGTFAEKEGKMEAALTWWKKAAAKGYGPSMHRLGEHAKQQGDMDAARAWWEKGKAVGDHASMDKLADLAEADGDAEALYELANLAFSMDREDLAEEWYLKAAHRGHADAMYWTGYFAWPQFEAQRWYRKAAKLGNLWAIDCLGEFAEEAQDFGEAMFEVALLADNARDEGRSRHWTEKAAGEGHVAAMYNAGSYAWVAGDVEAARTWWEKAAAAGDGEAMYELGVLAAADGDLEAASRWLEQSAKGELEWAESYSITKLRALAEEHESADAMCSLGNLAQVVGDGEAARTWWEKAAHAGDQ